MRRILAILLALSFSFSLAVPVAFAKTEPKLPACCRRDGKHKCGMAGEKTEAPKGQMSLSKGRCPQFPAAKSTPAAERDDLILADSGCRETLAAAQRDVRAVQTSSRARFLRRESQRGPPVLL